MIFSRTKGWIGVDIGTERIKLAQVERRGSRVELVEALSIPRQSSWLEEFASADVPSSFEIRAALALGTRFRGRDAAVTLPMAVCDLRTCKVPAGTDSERRAAVLRELDSIYTHTQMTRQFDYWSVDLPADNKGTADNTIALSVPLSWASRVTHDLREAGLVGHVLDGLPLATARAMTLGMPHETGLLAAVDWGHHRATFCLVSKGQPLFVRCLRDCGFHSVSDALVKTLALTADEAQQLLRTHGLPSPRQGTVSEIQAVVEEVMREPLHHFIDELNRTTTYLSQQRRGLAPAKVVLLGGGAAVNNMSGYLQERIELPVGTWALGATTTPDTCQTPIEMFGPAIALSSLAWMAR